MTLNCLYSGEDFSPKRSNQKFASAQNRINYHNSKMCSIRKSRSFVDTKLHRNYRILTELMDGKASLSFHKQYMLGKGYSFDVLTHFEDEEGERYKAVYEFLVFEKGDAVHLRKYK